MQIKGRIKIHINKSSLTCRYKNEAEKYLTQLYHHDMLFHSLRDIDRSPLNEK